MTETEENSKHKILKQKKKKKGNKRGPLWIKRG